MTDLQVLTEFCDRFGYEYEAHETYDGEIKVYSQGEEYYFSKDGDLIN